MEITEREDGILELRPVVAVPASQAWFWTPEWQLREREVDAEIAAGHGLVHEDADALLAYLDKLDSEA
jgi:hypothetical protein